MRMIPSISPWSNVYNNINTTLETSLNSTPLSSISSHRFRGGPSSSSPFRVPSNNSNNSSNNDFEGQNDSNGIPENNANAGDVNAVPSATASAVEERVAVTICDRIKMIGARNYLMPSHPLSRRCLGRYKRFAFFICIITTISCVVCFWNALVRPLPMVGRKLFIAEKYKDMFITDEYFYPTSAMLIIYITMILSGWALHYTHKPEYGPGFNTFVHSSRCVMIFGLGVLCWHLWAYFQFYPDAIYRKSLEQVMTKTIGLARDIHVLREEEKHELNYESRTPLKVWEDTQTVFKCCGIQSYLDWMPKNVSENNHLMMTQFKKYVPKTCCGKLVSDDVNTCEAMYVFKKGCLQNQLDALTKDALWHTKPALFFAVVSYTIFYIMLGRIFSNTVALTRTGRPFETRHSTAPNANEALVPPENGPDEIPVQ